VEVYNDRSKAFNKPHALEPLDQDNEVKKKKKKKDKKHRSKRSVLTVNIEFMWRGLETGER
jgi:hypothetical protein